MIRGAIVECVGDSLLLLELCCKRVRSALFLYILYARLDLDEPRVEGWLKVLLLLAGHTLPQYTCS